MIFLEKVAPIFCIVVSTLWPGTSFAQEITSGKTIVSLNSTFAIFDQKNGPDDGTQWFTPLSVVHTTQNWDLGFKTAFIRSERDSSAAGNDGRVNTITDTVISGTYRAFGDSVSLLGDRRVTLAFNADVNLPTGKDQLAGSDKNAVFDSFLVDQDRFGEGPNLGLGVSGTLAITDSLLWGLGASYILRGEFSPDGDEPDRVLDPGDQLVLSTQFLHAGPRHQVNLGYRLIDEKTTQVDDTGIFDRALSHEFFGSAAYQVTDDISVGASGLYGFRGKDDVFDPTTGRLAKADQDNNGDAYYLSLGAGYRFSERDQFGLDISRRVRGENDFDEENFSFSPSLQRDEIEISYDRIMSNGVTLSTGVSYFQVDEGSILGFDGPEFDGFTFSLGVKYVF